MTGIADAPATPSDDDAPRSGEDTHETAGPAGDDTALRGAEEPASAGADCASEDGAGTEAPDSFAEPEPPPPPPPPPRTLLDILREQLAEKESKLHEYIAAYKSAKTDMDERVARMTRDREKTIDRDRKALVGDLLEVLDNLDRSVLSIGEPESRKGVAMVQFQLFDVLTRFGVQRTDSLGADFDAKLHEAIGMVPAHSGQRDQEIVHVDRAGYLFKGELLRPARVVVASRG